MLFRIARLQYNRAPASVGRFVPYAVALLISLLVTGLGALLYQRELRDTALRPRAV